MNGRSRLMTHMGIALAVGVVGMTMVMYALERTSLIAFANAAGADHQTPLSTYVTMFAGLTVLYGAVFWALKRWSRFLRENRTASQLPVWFLAVLMIGAGLAAIIGIANHSGWARAQDPVPLEPNLGYIAYLTVMGTLVTVALVLVAVRWSPGYRRRSTDA